MFILAFIFIFIYQTIFDVTAIILWDQGMGRIFALNEIGVEIFFIFGYWAAVFIIWVEQVWDFFVL